MYLRKHPLTPDFPTFETNKTVEQSNSDFVPLFSIFTLSERTSFIHHFLKNNEKFAGVQCQVFIENESLNNIVCGYNPDPTDNSQDIRRFSQIFEDSRRLAEHIFIKKRLFQHLSEEKGAKGEMMQQIKIIIFGNKIFCSNPSRSPLHTASRVTTHGILSV